MSEQIEGQLTLFPEDSLASHLVLPGNREAKKMTATSGQKWLGLSKNYGPLGLLEKMLLESLEWHSPIFYLNWKPVDIGQGYFLFQLVLLAPDTGDIEWQSWPTPDTMCYRDGNVKRKEAKGRHAMSLNHAVAEEPMIWKTPVASDAANRKMYVNSRGEPNLSGQVKIWPTPKARQRGDCPAERKRKSPDLAAAVKMYNTPTAQDAKNSTLPKSQINRDSLVGDVMREMFATPQARDYRTGQTSRWKDKEHRSRNLNDQCGGQLNPYWVEWLMGFPPGWTEIS